jgi:hypothetical protein
MAKTIENVIAVFAGERGNARVYMEGEPIVTGAAEHVMASSTANVEDIIIIAAIEHTIPIPRLETIRASVSIHSVVTYSRLNPC